MILFLVSIIFSLIVFYKNKIEISNLIHWIFLGFIILYNFFPYLIYKIFPNMNSIPFTLYINRFDVLNKQIIISSFCLITYSIILLFNKKKVYLSFYGNKLPELTINPIYLYFLLFPIGFYLSSQFNWTSGERSGIGASITAYFRNILQVLGIIIFVRYRKKEKIRIIILLSFILLSYVDTQRTNLFVLFISYILTLKNKKNMLIYFIGLIIVIALIGILRNGVNILNFLYPFIGEGVFGSYGLMQTIEVVDYNYNYSLILYSLNGVINLFLSYIGASTSLYTVNNYMSEMYTVGVIKEKFIPMGGYFYPAAAHLVLPYIGPIILTIIFAIIIFKVNKIKQDAYLKVILYSNLFLLFKARFYIALNFVIFQLICYYFIYFINHLLSIIVFNKHRRLKY